MIVCKNKGIFFNQIAYLEQTFKLTVVENEIDNHQNLQELCSFTPKDSFFIVRSPHIARKFVIELDKDRVEDSFQYAKSASECKLEQKRLPGKVRKKRKRKLPFNEGELKMMEYHENIKSHLYNAVLDVSQHFPIDLKCQSNRPSPLKNNVSSAHHNCLLVNNTDCAFPLSKLINRTSTEEFPEVLVENTCSFSHMVKVSGNSYLIPKHSKFLYSDIRNLDPLMNDCKSNGKYSCVVMDPPWENKSVKRSRRYNTLSFDEIASIPMHEFCEDGCLIIIWVTNKQKIMKWVKDVLFKKWNITFITEWHWVKLTIAGEPVFPWDSLHKKPYETMLLGCYKNNNVLSECKLIHDLVLCSMPSAIHSHKPPLCKIVESHVKPLYKEPIKCLELFARNLNPGWTSWGNEVLMMQNVLYFD